MDGEVQEYVGQYEKQLAGLQGITAAGAAAAAYGTALSGQYEKQLAGMQGITAAGAAAAAYGTALSSEATGAMANASRLGLAMQGDPLAGIVDKTYYPDTQPDLARLRTAGGTLRER